MPKAKWFIGFASIVAIAFAATFVRYARLPTIIPEAVASTPIAAETTVRADGRVAVRPGRQATLSAEMTGRLTLVHVVEGQSVKKGTVLAELDAKEYLAALREAWGSASEASARARARRDDLRRAKELFESGSLPRHEADRMKEEKSAAEGRLGATHGAAARARALVAKTKIVAPIDGVIVSRFVEPAETVSPGTPLFVIADLSERRVEAEVDEYDVGRVTLGTPAEVRADGFAGTTFRGIVEEIPSLVGPRRLRPQDPGRLTDSAVLLVKITLPPESPLKLGQRVSVVLTERAREEREGRRP